MNCYLRMGLSGCVVALGLSACTGMNSSIDGQTFKFTAQQQCPALLEMDVGQTLELQLNENLSTGYQWSLVEPLKLFDVESIYHTAEASSSAQVGQGGQKIFYFQAIKAGQELLHVKHARAWEKTAIQEWQCRVRIS